MTEHAKLLRTAAAVLRLAAKHASPSPWVVTTEAATYGGLVTCQVPMQDFTSGYGGELIAETLSPANRAYLQLVHPDTGLRLADWLDVEADQCAGADRIAAMGIGRRVETPHELVALTVANAVLRTYLS